MNPKELRGVITRLPETTFLSKEFEKRDNLQGVSHVWNKSQKEHWLGWLTEHDGVGAYKRKDANRDARFVYNHFQCSPGLLWLAEASGVDQALLIRGRDAMIAAQDRSASQCAAFRQVVPWDLVEEVLRERSKDTWLERLMAYIRSLIHKRV